MKPLSPVKEFKRQAAVWHNDVQDLVAQWKSFSPQDQAATVQVLLFKAAAFYEESVFDACAEHLTAPVVEATVVRYADLLRIYPDRGPLTGFVTKERTAFLTRLCATAHALGEAMQWRPATFKAVLNSGMPFILDHFTVSAPFQAWWQSLSTATRERQAVVAWNSCFFHIQEMDGVASLRRTLVQEVLTPLSLTERVSVFNALMAQAHDRMDSVTVDNEANRFRWLLELSAFAEAPLNYAPKHAWLETVTQGSGFDRSGLRWADSLSTWVDLNVLNTRSMVAKVSGPGWVKKVGARMRTFVETHIENGSALSAQEGRLAQVRFSDSARLVVGLVKEGALPARALTTLALEFMGPTPHARMRTLEWMESQAPELLPPLLKATCRKLLLDFQKEPTRPERDIKRVRPRF